MPKTYDVCVTTLDAELEFSVEVNCVDKFTKLLCLFEIYQVLVYSVLC